jgi:hypothetical protein
MPIAAVPLPVPTEGQASFNSIVSTQSRAARGHPLLTQSPHRHTPNLVPLIVGVEIGPIDPMTPDCTVR